MKETVDLKHVHQWLKLFEFKALDIDDNSIYISIEPRIYTFHILLIVNNRSYKMNF